MKKLVAFSVLFCAVSAIAQVTAGCTKNISFAVAEAGQVAPRVPKFAAKWISKNQKKYPTLCFSQIPSAGNQNYVLIFATSRSAFNGIYPTVRTNTTTSSSPVSGSGTVTDNSGEMWNYTYSGTETTTTTTQTEVNVPYTDTSSTLYVFAYRWNGTVVSDHWRTVTTRQGGDAANTAGYNLGAALGAIHLREHLLADSIKDIGGDCLHSNGASVCMLPASRTPVTQHREIAPVSTSAVVAETPGITPVATERLPCESAIDSHIDGDFNGWEGETIYKIDNGEIWQQSTYHYHYHYAYRPEIIIFKSASGCHMRVMEDDDEGADVTRLK